MDDVALIMVEFAYACCTYFLKVDKALSVCNTGSIQDDKDSQLRHDVINPGFKFQSELKICDDSGLKMENCHIIS